MALLPPKKMIIDSMLKLKFLGSLILVLIVLGGCEKYSAEKEYQDSLQSITIEEGMDFFFYCDVDIHQAQDIEQYKNLLVYVHGASLNGADHFGDAIDAINQTGLSSSTIVLAPQYEMTNTRNNYYWTKYSWKDGKKSINAVPKISSYAIFDSLLINNVLKSYNQIQTIVIAGHSAGGQFVYRYAVLSKLPDSISQEVIYLPMNPSAVTYLGPERWNKDKNRFEIPLNAPSCSAYDDWIYGLSNISTNEYDRNITASSIKEVFPWRNLTIGTGTEDLEGQGESTDCEDLYQGLHRHERANNAYHYMKTFYPSTLHQKIDVQGVAHNRTEMINSPEIVSFLSEVFD